MFPCKMAIDKLTVKVKGTHYSTGKNLLRSPVFTAENIKTIFSRVISQGEILHSPDIRLCTLNLGVIPAAQFAAQFNQRLEKALTEYLSTLHNAPDVLPEMWPEVQQQSASTSDPLTLLARVHQDTEVLYALAVCCLQPQPRQVILRSRQTAQVQLLLQRLLQGAVAYRDLPAVATFTRITGSRLALAALFWLWQDRRGLRWLSEHHPDTAQWQTWWAAIASGEISAEQITALLSYRPASTQWPAVARRWLVPLWQQKTVRNIVRQHAGKTVAEAIDADLGDGLQPAARQATQPDVADRQATPVSNAGLVLLWPLLPQLFSLLELTQDNAFPDEDARWQAVLCLDGLAGRAGQPGAERLALNRLLCGIAEEVPLPELAPFSPQQQQLTDDWLTAVSQQLPAWQKFSLTDIRQLFLQRPGEINTETQPPQISVQPESFDALLGNWPWPLTLVQLPWLAQPLTLIWPFHQHTG